MKNKIILLIIASVAALVALSSIQGYLIKNTYSLKKEAFIKETKDALYDYIDKQNQDSIMIDWTDNLKGYVTDYVSNRIPKADIIEKQKARSAELESLYIKNFDQVVDDLGLDYHIDYLTQIISIVILDRNGNDTIFKNNPNNELIIGKKFDEEELYQVNKALTVMEHTYFLKVDSAIVSDSFTMEIKSINKIKIENWKSIIFGRLAALFIGSILLFLFVVGLMYFSIKNLITEKKITEVKTDFINNITHELKTPLATLSIATQTLKNKELLKNPSAFNQTLSIVERQNNRLQKLIDQVMSNSLSSNDITLSKEQVLDSDYFKNILSDFRLASQRKDLKIIDEICPENVYLRIDKFHFSTAILNILENAVKYGVDDTQILFKTSLSKSEYVIEIADNGIGITENDIAQIFDKFYRVSDGNVHEVKGLGLGLYYTNQIIHAHKGSIFVDSEINKGTQFTIKIPLQ